jgi:hypothetical protein
VKSDAGHAGQQGPRQLAVRVSHEQVLLGFLTAMFETKPKGDSWILSVTANQRL